MTFDQWLQSRSGLGMWDNDGTTIYEYDGERLRNSGEGEAPDPLPMIQGYYDHLMTPDAQGRLRFGAEGRAFTNNSSGGADWDTVNVGGKDYLRTGFDMYEAYKDDPELGPILRQAGVTGPSYDQQHGFITSPETFKAVQPILEARNKGGKFDWLPKAFAGIATGAIMGGAFPGIDAMTGAAIPAGQTSLWSGVKSMMPGSESWGVNPRFTMSDMTAQDLVNLADPPFRMSMPGISTPGSSGLIPGASGFAGSATDLMAAAKQNSSASVGAGGTNAGGSMWDSFLQDLIKPSTLLPLAGQAISGITGLMAANNAADIQSDAVNQANENLAPWFNAGGRAINTLADRTIGPNADLTRRFTMADLEADPVYQTSRQFGMDEGQQAIERKFAATGGGNSGAAAKAIARYASDYTGQRAGDAFNRFQTQDQNIFNRIAGVAGAGQNAANQTASNTIGMGNANAAANIAGSNAVGGAVNGFLNNWQNQQFLNRLPIYTQS